MEYLVKLGMNSISISSSTDTQPQRQDERVKIDGDVECIKEKRLDWQAP